MQGVLKGEKRVERTGVQQEMIPIAEQAYGKKDADVADQQETGDWW